MDACPARYAKFLVTLYDVTAAFTPWGMYNISAKTTELPENAGVAGVSTVSRSSMTSSWAPNMTALVRQTTLSP